MSDSRADSPALGLAGPKPSGEGWPLKRWLALIALICAVHVALLYAFGARKPIVPRTVTDVPMLKLTGHPDELLALRDPTLFALPHLEDFVVATRSQPPVADTPTPSFRWPEPSLRWLPLSENGLLSSFNQFLQTNYFTGSTNEFKPPLKLNTPTLPIEPALTGMSTVRIEGDLARRRLLTPMDLPSWPYADVIAPSRVQVLVSEAGDVVSAILLPSYNSLEARSHYDVADQDALKAARTARFAPAPHLTIGYMIFTWHTVPPPATNSPAASP